MTLNRRGFSSTQNRPDFSVRCQNASTSRRQSSDLMKGGETIETIAFISGKCSSRRSSMRDSPRLSRMPGDAHGFAGELLQAQFEIAMKLRNPTPPPFDERMVVDARV